MDEKENQFIMRLKIRMLNNENSNNKFKNIQETFQAQTG